MIQSLNLTVRDALFYLSLGKWDAYKFGEKVVIVKFTFLMQHLGII
jgi:hypothetical protein